MHSTTRARTAQNDWRDIVGEFKFQWLAIATFSIYCYYYFDEV